ncbi:MAG: DUF6444 domain-containing protein [Rhodobacteraceae bacterium]|nr:DUF6444 domain-containing protein [Paracoccaceae bacterium]
MIKPFPSPSCFASDAAAMGRHVKELEDHLHKRDEHIRELESIMVANRERIAGLERRLALDSTNGSRPPSSDGWRTPLRRRPGGT